MSLFFVFSEYFVWQYTSGIGEFLRAWGNLHWFLFYFFSFPMLLRTLFQPLYRLKEGYSRHFDVEQALEAVTVNLIMRVTGFITRVFLLFVGLIVECAVFVVGCVTFVLYLLSPVGAPLLFIIFLSLI